MGIAKFWKSAPKEAAAPPPPVLTPMSSSAPTPYSKQSGFSSRASLASGQVTPIGEDIKHDVMCNYIAQQQRTNQWIDEHSGTYQGVMIRKRLGVYSAAPRALAASHFAHKCTQLNLQVCRSAVCYSVGAQELTVS